MSDNLINDISRMLNEEKWTRATLNDYAVGNFHELDKIVEKVIASELHNDVISLCEEHLASARNSISALYISGVISLNKQQVDDSHLLNLIEIFSDNHKWAAVEHLCQRILNFGENKDALRILAETLGHLNKYDTMYEIWERLINVDYSETEIVKHLAEHKEANGDIQGAILYYRKAVYRFVNTSMFSQVREVWKKLVELGVDDYEFFFLIEKKVAKSMSTERAVNLLEDLYPAVKEQEEWAVAINVLKRILNYDSRNHWARKEIIVCYKEHYAGHSQVDECIKLSNLNQNWRSAMEAIADFEKHISFDSGSFVFHKTWGVGRIKGIKGNDISIDFAKKRNHTMSLKMAMGSLQSLASDHIWVLKSIHVKKKLNAKAKEDIPWALKTVIRSFDNRLELKKIKSELVPSILSPGEWTSWIAEAKEILKTDPAFGNDPDKLDQFVVRDRPISFEEKAFNRFKAEKSIFDKIQATREFLEHATPDSEFFAEIFRYFSGFLSNSNPNIQNVASYLFVEWLVSEYPFLNPALDWGFKELWACIENPVEVFSKLDDSELRKRFLSLIHSNINNWESIYLDIFPIELSKYIVDALLKANYRDQLISKLEDMIEHYREYPDGILWIARNASEGHWLNELNLKTDKIFINLIRLLDYTITEIENKQNSVHNRKINRQIQTYLFKEKQLESFISQSDKNTVNRIYTLLNSIKEMDPVIKRDIRSTIHLKFPDIVLYVGKSQETLSRSSQRYFYVLETSLNIKQKELKHLIEVEIPKNSREIGAAIELGDLSENAEYKAGKEKQEALQIQVGKLQDELERARLSTSEEGEAGKIGFGTIITLEDIVESKEVSYTILGPWESDPAKHIISYQSPFGNAFLGKKSGDELTFNINDRNYQFVVKKVEPFIS